MWTRRGAGCQALKGTPAGHGDGGGVGAEARTHPQKDSESRRLSTCRGMDPRASSTSSSQTGRPTLAGSAACPGEPVSRSQRLSWDAAAGPGRDKPHHTDLGSAGIFQRFIHRGRNVHTRCTAWDGGRHVACTDGRRPPERHPERACTPQSGHTAGRAGPECMAPSTSGPFKASHSVRKAPGCWVVLGGWGRGVPVPSVRVGCGGHSHRQKFRRSGHAWARPSECWSSPHARQ